MSLPTFFVIGAQKCGTTALYMALRQHPQIYMSPRKEPRFFAFAGQAPNFCGPGSELFRQDVIYERAAYEALFSQAGSDQVRGEASPIYLSSYQPAATAQQIQARVPDARLIAILRQPAQRAWSAYLHHRRLGLEPLPDFRKALAQETARTTQHWYPGWRYRQNGFYAANLRPYFDLFERQQIRVYLYEEWNKQPSAVLADIFQFLQVDPSFQPDLTQRHNVSLVPRSQWLQRLLQNCHGAWCRWLCRLCTTLNQSRPHLPSTIYQQLTAQYRVSIEMLAQLLDRDLTDWQV
jgi:Sulfotransferase family